MSTRRRQAGGHRYAVIMAGGTGKRFWPHSRRRRPKQFLSIDGSGASLLQATAQRLRGVVPWSRVMVVAPAEHARLVRRQLSALPRANLLIEPAARGTAACLALAAARIAQPYPAAAMGVFPADHTIAPAAQFRRCATRAFEVAETHDCLVTLGIPPRGPETGYGYIELGTALRSGTPRVNWAVRFVEKPNRARAQQFVDSGRHVWNSGMFFWRVSVLRDGLQRHAPAVARVMQAMENPRRAAAATVRRLYRRLPTESIDVALMERAERVAVVAATFDWNDVGSWAALASLWGA